MIGTEQKKNVDLKKKKEKEKKLKQYGKQEAWNSQSLCKYTPL